MAGLVQKVVVVGGGSAGWLAACRIAAEHGRRGVETTLVEAPDVPIIGVGEGTWPSMRHTLQQIGFDEDELLACCDASFKQGTRFVGWRGRAAQQGRQIQQDAYLHPFSLPAEYPALSLAAYWLASETRQPFADFVCPQAAVAQRGLAPKQAQTAPYACNVNYAYHLDAHRFAERLKAHAVQRLGVRHLEAKVTGVASDSQGDIAALQLDGSAQPGDLFVDCTGSRALLLGGHYGVKDKPLDGWLFNDRAIAVQVPYADSDAPIASTTVSTATECGWIWDIGLQSRRGLGHVYSSAHATEDQAMAALQDYIGKGGTGKGASQLAYKNLKFQPAHKEQAWVRNCVALGMAAGFVEPLEASALALVEQGAAMLAAQLPRDRALMPLIAQRYNQKMLHHWQRILEFLKLHYCLSQRSAPYWQAHRQPETWPSELQDKLALWQQQPPGHDDAPLIEELFPAASYQYVLYGMGFTPRHSLAEGAGYARHRERADRALHQVAQEGERFAQALPSNRALIAARLAACQKQQQQKQAAAQ